MTDERPLQEARSALQDGKNTQKSYEPPQYERPPRRQGGGLFIAGILLVVALICGGVSLPPISLWERVGLVGGDEVAAQTVAPTAEANTGAEGNTNVEPTSETVAETAPEPVANLAPASDFAVDGVSDLTASMQNGVEFTPASSLASTERLASPVYVLNKEGSVRGSANIAIPSGLTNYETVDVVGWDGSAWHFMPSRLDLSSLKFVSNEAELPEAMALVQTDDTDRSDMTVVYEVMPEQEVPADLLPLVTDMSVGQMTLTENGELVGSTATVPQGEYAQWLRAKNMTDDAGIELLGLLLNDTALQTTHVNNLVNAMNDGEYAGIHLNYQGINAIQRDNFTDFVTTLADTLHAQGKALALTLATPVADSNGNWDTAGQDWAALGQIADVTFVQMPLDPTAYADNGDADQILSYAVRNLDRNRTHLLVTAEAIQSDGETFVALPNDQALVSFGSVGTAGEVSEVAPESPVNFMLTGTANPLEWDSEAISYKYSYNNDEGIANTVWVSNEAALNHRLRFAEKYQLAGVVVQGIGNLSEAAGYTAALQSQLTNTAAPTPAGAAIVWTIMDSNGTILEQANGEALSYLWTAPAAEGDYVVSAEFIQGDARASLGEMALSVRPSEVADATDETTADSDGNTTDAGASTDAPLGAVDGGTAVINIGANVRTGPGLSYPPIAGLDPGTPVTLIGRDATAGWFNIQMQDGGQGWVFAPLLDINEGFDVNSLAVIQVGAPPPFVAAPETAPESSPTAEAVAQLPPAGPTNTPWPTRTPLPQGPWPGVTTPTPWPTRVPTQQTAPPPIVGGSFELGGQTHTLEHPGEMKYAGMSWVKFQHKWSNGDTGEAVRGRIEQAHANGFKVLLSIPGSDHSNINYSAYVQFLGQVAALGPDAIEIWNEGNIDREWPAGQISANTYVNQMLKPAYQAIKAANSNVMVISGAPAPTGFFGGCSGAGCDDNFYMQQMAAAGGAAYMDCIGVHYNEGIISPTQRSGDPRGSSNHYSRYFWGMVDTYYNAFGGSRRLCFTELGYLSGEGFGGLPGGFSWASSTTVSQQAQWLAEAASLSASSGKVRMMIIFNVDFTHFGEDPQAGFAMIRPGGACPACDTLRAVTGGR